MENDKNKKLWQKRTEIKGDYLDEIKKIMEVRIYFFKNLQSTKIPI